MKKVLANSPVDTPQQCSFCNELKPASAYDVDPRARNGLKAACKHCARERQRMNHARHKGAPVLNPRQTKKCPKCGEDKERLNFFKETSSDDGLGPWCKTCVSAHKKERYLALKESRASELEVFIQEQKKVCSKCGQVKERLDFYKAPNMADGLFSFCKACSNVQQRQRRQANLAGKQSGANEAPRLAE
jgi:hypothetical protein